MKEAGMTGKRMQLVRQWIGGLLAVWLLMPGDIGAQSQEIGTLNL